MGLWFMIIVTACITALLNALFSVFKPKLNLPPGPRVVPILSTLLWLKKSSMEVDEMLRKLSAKFGGIITLNMGSHPLIFVSSRTLAHEALIQQGANFADRPEATLTNRIMRRNQYNISSCGYGPVWRLLRRNLTSQILHPSKSKEFSSARRWTLDILITHLREGRDHPEGVKVIAQSRFAMFCLLVFMCFGVKMDEKHTREVEEVVQPTLKSFNRYQMLNFMPWLTRVLLRSLWNEFLNLRKRQEEVIIPYIRARKQLHYSQDNVTCYVDTLLDLKLSEDGNSERKLSDEEIVTACVEFLTAGTDTTSTTLQWIMANLVKYPHIQAKLFEEIKRVVGEEAEEVGEDELSKMPYLKAVVLEGLRRHPPGHFVLPHAVTKDAELGGYTVPKNAIVNFLIAEIAWDPEVWDDPLEFRPERFISREGRGVQDEFDITGTREIKMMPFGVGRRICPATGLAMLHLEYYVANLVWKFEWKSVDGKAVDLTEKQEFTIVMKNPLHAHISPR